MADLVDNLPSNQRLRHTIDINNRGDLLGFGTQGDYLLERIGGGKD